MIDLDNIEVEIPCNSCKFNNKVLIKQIKSGDIIICRGCRRDINLADYSNDIAEKEREANEALRSLKETAMQDVNIDIKF